MFDVGFWEITLIMLVTLVVVGPERLPKLARTLGAWVSKARRMISDVKAEVDRELRADELKGSLGGNAVDDLRKMAGEIKNIGDELKSDVESFQPTVKPASTQPEVESGGALPGKPAEPTEATPESARDT
jgi:sec-independent protein translocase protein TatB